MRRIVIVVTVDGNTSTSLGIGVQVDPARVPAQRELRVRGLIPLPPFGQSTKTTFIFWFASIGQKARYIEHAVPFTKGIISAN